MLIFKTASALKLLSSPGRPNLLPSGVFELSDELIAEVNGGNILGDAVINLGQEVSKKISPPLGQTIITVGKAINNVTDDTPTK